MRNVSSERGSAIVLALFALVIVSGLAAAMVTSGHSELLIVRNEEQSAQGRASAEAGLNHALEATIADLSQWQTNGFASRSAAMNRLFRGPDNLTGTTATNADNGSLALLGINGRVTLNAASAAAYEVRVYDEDDPARGLTLTTADRVRIGEDGNAFVDANQRMVVRATGFAGGDASVVLEATLGPLMLPAIVTNGSLTISGSPSVEGSQGSVHANTNLLVSGNPTVAENATASSTYSATGTPNVGGQAGGGRPLLSVPPVRAIDHRTLADFVLTNTGQMTLLNGTVVCDASADADACKNLGFGWVWQGSGTWDITSNTAANGTYFVEGNAKISGNPGSAMVPLAISIIATGYIDITGNPDLRPDLPELMFVTDMDLRIAGNLAMPQNFEGQILVREQMHLAGNPSLSGQIIVEDVPSVCTLVTQNEIVGNPTITYNGLAGSNSFGVTAWREVR